MFEMTATTQQVFHICAAVLAAVSLQRKIKKTSMWSSSAFVQTANEVHSFWARLRFCIQLTFRRESLSAVGYPRRPRAPLRHLRLAKQNAKVRRGTELQKVTRAFTGEAVSSGLPHFKKHPAVTSRSAVHAEFQR